MEITVLSKMRNQIEQSNLGYVWFPKNTKERKKMRRKMIFSCFSFWLSYKKYKRKSNIIKIN